MAVSSRGHDHEVVVVAVVVAAVGSMREHTGDVDGAGTSANASVSPFLVYSEPSRETSKDNATTASLADAFAHVQPNVRLVTLFLWLSHRDSSDYFHRRPAKQQTKKLPAIFPSVSADTAAFGSTRLLIKEIRDVSML